MLVITKISVVIYSYILIFIHSFIHSSEIRISGPGTVVGIEDTAVNKTKISAFQRLLLWSGGDRC